MIKYILLVMLEIRFFKTFSHNYSNYNHSKKWVNFQSKTNLVQFIPNKLWGIFFRFKLNICILMVMCSNSDNSQNR